MFFSLSTINLLSLFRAPFFLFRSRTESMNISTFLFHPLESYTHTHTEDCIICKQSGLWFPLLLRATRRDNEILKRFLRPRSCSLDYSIDFLVLAAHTWRRRGGGGWFPRGGFSRTINRLWRWVGYIYIYIGVGGVITLKVPHKRVVVSRMILHSLGYYIISTTARIAHHGNYTAWDVYMYTHFVISLLMSRSG